jgi:hypothetical protein
MVCEDGGGLDMPHLTHDADNLVRATIDAFVAGKLKPDARPETVYASKNSTYRVVAGRIHQASDTSLTGAELVAFLVEDGKAVRVLPLWTRKARAIFFERTSREVVVTSRIMSRSEGPALAKHATPLPGSIPPAPRVPAFKPGAAPPPPPLEEPLSFGAERTQEEITKVEPPPTLRSENPPTSEGPPTLRIPDAGGSVPERTTRDTIDETGDDAPTKIAPDAKRKLPPVKPPPHKKRT